MKLLRDHPTSKEFALESGQLIQNFGIVELTTYRWIEVLSGSSTAMEISMELPLSKRIDIILKLLKRDPKQLAPDKVKEAAELWAQLRDKGCELRNSVAHGTIGLRFPTADTTGQPQSAGILKLQKWKDTDQLITLEELRGAVNVTGNIAQRLSAML
jgi:hypothetical protein